MCRDPSIWPEPDAFRPGRWLLPADSEEVLRRHPYSFVPFLGGPRSCIGQRFAMQVAGGRGRCRPAQGCRSRAFSCPSRDTAPAALIKAVTRSLIVEVRSH